MSTTENGRPEREARFHSADSASQKKRRVLIPVRPSVIDCCCSFWKTKALCKRGREQVGERVEDQNILRRESILAAAFDVEHAEQRFAVGDRNAEHCTRIGKNPGQIAGQGILDKSAFAGASDASENANPQRDTLAHGVSGSSGFSLDFNFFGAVVEQSDADVVEAEILLDLTHDLAQHMNGIIAGDGRARNVVEECELAGTALLFGKQAGIFDRDGDLSGSGDEHVQIALLENEFAVGIHRDHDSGRLVPHENRGSNQAFGGALRNMADAQSLPRVLSSSERISSGSALRITNSVNAFRSSRVRLGRTRLSRISSSKRI